jgi:histidinol phosphatase-like enzyme
MNDDLERQLDEFYRKLDPSARGFATPDPVWGWTGSPNFRVPDDLPPQTLTFALLAGATNATLNTSSGAFSFRPLVTQTNSTNGFTLKVADNGTPSLSATQSFAVMVNPLSAPSVSNVSAAGGQFGFSVSGQSGPDYAIEASTNLASWTPIWVLRWLRAGVDILMWIFGWLIFDLDDFVASDTPVLEPDAVHVDQRRASALRAYRSDGLRIFVHAWRPEVARGETTAEAVDACLARLGEIVGGGLDFGCCPHDAGPPACWCRKPIPGSVLEFATRRGVSLSRSIVVGASAADRTMAERIGARFELSEGFFGGRL